MIAIACPLFMLDAFAISCCSARTKAIKYTWIFMI